MKATEYIRKAIDRLPRGYVFTYEDFYIDVKQKEAIIKALNRMAKSGKISKLAKGKYFKPENTPFGSLQPNTIQIVKDLLVEDGKTVGYLTGNSIYNQLGLTTQISNTIQIGKNQTRPKFKRERYTISFVRQKNLITKKNIPLLQILDCIRFIKKIPGTSIKTSCLRLIQIIKSLDLNDKKVLIRLSLKYPPSSRAILGALIDKDQNSDITQVLEKSLNPITKYKLPELGKVLEPAIKWNIV